MNSISLKAIYVNIFKLVNFWLAILIVFSVMRLIAPFVGMRQSLFGPIANTINFFLFSLSIAALCATISKKNKIHPILLIISLVCCYGTAVGFLNGYKLVQIIKHFYMPIYGGIALTFGFHLYKYVTLKIFNYMMRFTFIVNLFTSISFFFLQTVFVIYPGYGTQAIAYVSLYYLVMQRYYSLFISLLIVVIQGKRSVLLCTFLCIYIYMIMKLVRSWLLTILSIVIIFPSIVVLFLYLMEDFNLYTLPGLSRLKFINPFSDFYSLALGSSGRFDEILSALAVFSKNIANFFFGSGFGFSYDWLISYRNTDVETKGYLHMTPLLVFFILGPIITIAFYAIFFSISIFSLKRSELVNDLNNCRLVQYYGLASIYFLISGFFSLNILADYMGWIFLGLNLGFISSINFRKTNVRNSWGHR